MKPMPRRRCLLCSCLCIGLVLMLAPHMIDAAPLSIQEEQYRDQTVLEKQILERKILDYADKIHQIELDQPGLKSQEEWLLLKIEHLGDLDRTVPKELNDHLELLRLRMTANEKEKARIDELMKTAVNRLKDLDAEVKDRFAARERRWWTIAPQVAGIAKIPHKPGYSFETVPQAADPYSGQPPEPSFDTEPSLSSDPNYPLPPESSTVLPEEEVPLDLPDDLQLELEEKLHQAKMADWAKLRKGDSRLLMEVKLPIVFAPGKALLEDHDLVFLGQLADLLRAYSPRIIVEGFSEKLPSSASPAASAWELAALRAIAVTRELVRLGIPPSAFTIVSHGEFGVPTYNVAQNDTEPSRRVEMTVSFPTAPASEPPAE